MCTRDHTPTTHNNNDHHDYRNNKTNESQTANKHLSCEQQLLAILLRSQCTHLVFCDVQYLFVSLLFEVCDCSKNRTTNNVLWLGNWHWHKTRRCFRLLTRPPWLTLPSAASQNHLLSPALFSLTNCLQRLTSVFWMFSIDLVHYIAKSFTCRITHMLFGQMLIHSILVNKWLGLHWEMLRRFKIIASPNASTMSMIMKVLRTKTNLIVLYSSIKLLLSRI